MCAAKPCTDIKWWHVSVLRWDSLALQQTWFLKLQLMWSFIWGFTHICSNWCVLYVSKIKEYFPLQAAPNLQSEAHPSSHSVPHHNKGCVEWVSRAAMLHYWSWSHHQACACALLWHKEILMLSTSSYFVLQMWRLGKEYPKVGGFQACFAFSPCNERRGIVQPLNRFFQGFHVLTLRPGFALRGFVFSWAAGL